MISKNRNTSIDIIKLLAMFFVTAVHFRNRTERLIPIDDIHIKHIFNYSLIYAIFIIAVPLFIIISGYLSKKENHLVIDLKKPIFLYLKYIIFALLSYSIMVLFQIRQPRSLTNMITLALKFDLISGWYLEMYIGILIFSPFINKMFSNLRKNDKTRLIIALIFVISIPSFVNSLPLISKYVSLPNYWKDSYPIVYYMIGLYLKEVNILEIGKKYLNLMRLLTIFSFTSIFLLVFISAKPYTYSADGYYGSIIEVIYSVSFFVNVYYYFQVKNYNFEYLNIITKSSLFIYLSAYPVDKIVYGLLIPKYIEPEFVWRYFIPIVPICFVLSVLNGILFDNLYSGLIHFIKNRFIGNKLFIPFKRYK